MSRDVSPSSDVRVAQAKAAIREVVSDCRTRARLLGLAVPALKAQPARWLAISPPDWAVTVSTAGELAAVLKTAPPVADGRVIRVFDLDRTPPAPETAGDLDLSAVVDRACGPKHRFPTRATAARAATAARSRGHAAVAAYRCPFSGGGHWHIGHVPSLAGLAQLAQAIRWHTQTRQGGHR